MLKETKVSKAGTIGLIFDKDLIFPSRIYDLSSSNEGPTYFNITLEVNIANLKVNGLEAPSLATNGNEAPSARERRLESSNPYKFSWYVKKTKTINEIEIAVTFDNP